MYMFMCNSAISEFLQSTKTGFVSSNISILLSICSTTWHCKVKLVCCYQITWDDSLWAHMLRTRRPRIWKKCFTIFFTINKYVNRNRIENTDIHFKKIVDHPPVHEIHLSKHVDQVEQLATGELHHVHEVAAIRHRINISEECQWMSCQ